MNPLRPLREIFSSLCPPCLCVSRLFLFLASGRPKQIDELKDPQTEPSKISRIARDAALLCEEWGNWGWPNIGRKV